MKMSIQMDYLLVSLYPDRTMTVYLKTLKSEIEKLVGIEDILQKEDLIAYLKWNGYSKFVDQFDPLLQTVYTEPDFKLDDSLKSKEIKPVRNYTSHRHNRILLEKLSEAYDEEIIEQLVLNNQSLVHKVAARYQALGRSLSFEDLVNEGNIGLLKAISKYNKDYGYEFSTTAVKWIRQAIIRSIMNEGTTIRVPVHMHETINKIKKIERELMNEFPDVHIEEVLEKSEISLEKYRFAKTIEFRYLHKLSLNQTLTSENDVEYIDFISNCGQYVLSPDVYNEFGVEQQVFQKILTEELDLALDKFSERERQIVEFHFGLFDGRERTLEEIGKIFGITRERVRQIELQVFKRLRINPFFKEMQSFL